MMENMIENAAVAAPARRRRGVLGTFGVAVVMLVSMFGLVAPSVASAQTYPPAPENLTPDKPVAPPGSPVVLTATGFLPGSTVTFTQGGSTIGTAVADPSGTAVITWNIPAGFPPGPVTVVASGLNTDSQPGSANTTIDVQSSTPTTGGGGLPVTGSDQSGLFRIGLIVLAVGAVGVVIARRRVARS